MKFCFAADGSNLALQDRKIALVQGATEGLFETEKSADSVKIQQGLAKIKNFKGVTGDTTMDAKHNPKKAITIVKLENGKPSKGYVVK